MGLLSKIIESMDVDELKQKVKAEARRGVHGVSNRVRQELQSRIDGISSDIANSSDYALDDDDDEYAYWSEEVAEQHDRDVISGKKNRSFFVLHSEELPPGCSACGGPYPDCRWSCRIWDD